VKPYVEHKQISYGLSKITPFKLFDKTLLNLTDFIEI